MTTTTTPAKTCTWVGQSGKEYVYTIFPMSDLGTFKKVDGNYIFARQTSSTTFSAIYIGEGDLSERLTVNHHKMPCIRMAGATHIHAHINRDDAKRKAEEKDLLDSHNTPCNE